MEKKFWCVHVIAHCEDCEWTTDSYKNGQAIAAKHAKTYGHTVHVEVGLAGFYDGKK